MKCFALAFGLLFSILAAAQTGPKFPETAADFLPKLNEYVTSSHRPDCEEAMKVFEKSWKNNVFKADEQTRIMTQANRMAEFKLPVFPYFAGYLNALVEVKKQADTLLFDKWHPLVERTLSDLERGKNKPMENFLEFSNDFFNRRALKIGDGGNITWSAVGGRYEFGYLEKKPFIRFEKIRLEGVRKKDTIAIEQAICVYFPIENLIKGTSGTVFWKRTGLDSSVVAVLPSFEINANSAAYSVPEVSFSYPLYFPNQVLKGKFEDKVFVGGASVEGSYPKFESSETVLSIQNIGDPRL